MAHRLKHNNINRFNKKMNMKEFLSQYYQKVQKPSGLSRFLLFINQKTELFWDFLKYVTIISSFITLVARNIHLFSIGTVYIEMLSFCLVFFIGFVLALIGEAKQKHETKKLKNKLLSLMKKDPPEKELHSVLFKIRLIDIYHLDKKEILNNNVINQSIDELEHETISHKTIEFASNLMMNEVKLNHYCKDYQSLINLSKNALSHLVKIKLANAIIEQEKTLTQKESFIQKYSSIEKGHKEKPLKESIFKQEKKLNLSL